MNLKRNRWRKLCSFSHVSEVSDGLFWVQQNEQGRLERRHQRGIWAELMVVAKFAMNKTRDVTRMTTTPPTVNRSHKSEFVRIIYSSTKDFSTFHFPNSTSGSEICSDHRHSQAFSRCPDEI